MKNVCRLVILALVGISSVVAGTAVKAVAKSDAKGPQSRGSDNTGIEVVTVTAQKRTEKLLDVPTSISAIGGERLEALKVSSLADLTNYVPGMSTLSMGAPGARNIILRGLNTGYSNVTTAATVATYIDDLPIGSSNTDRGSQYGADLLPFDIERIEVLKGPQGTLYGSNAMGGLVKFVVRKPDLKEFEARAGTDIDYTDDAEGMNWAMRGLVNIPILTDKLGLRLSGYERHAAGYIDNVALGVRASNESTQQGGRVAMLWQATEKFAVRLTALGENVDADNVSNVTANATTGQLLYGPTSVASNFSTPLKVKTRNYALSLDWNVGFAGLTSTSGWSTLDWSRSEDYSVPYGAFCAPGVFTGCPDYPFADALALFQLGAKTRKFVQEIRLLSPASQRMQWMLGGYYTKEKNGPSDKTNGLLFSFPTFTPSREPLPEADNLLTARSGGSFEESAAFANVTYPFNDRFDVSGGVRRSYYEIVSNPGLQGGVIFGGALQATVGTRLPSTSVTTWMTNARLHIDQGAMLYARVATGYRPGGGCKTRSDGSSCAVPQLDDPGFYDPDKSTNYEIGVKGQFFDQRLQLDATVFYIDWTDIQLQVRSPRGFVYAGNAGDARSRGVELAASYQIGRDLRCSTTLAYTDAKLKDDAPGVGGGAGDRLPVVPLWTGSIALDYVHPLAGTSSLTLGGGYRYRDAIVNQFETTGLPVPMGPQNIVNLYVGFSIKNLTARLSGSNVFNDRSYNGLQYLNDAGMANFVPVQPRTIGLSLDYRL